MKNEFILALSNLVELFSWLIEVLIVWTSPGLLFGSVLYIIRPELKNYIQFDNSLGMFLYGILWPSLIGICLNSIGLLIFEFIARRIKFFEKIERQIEEQFANAELASMDYSLSAFLNEEQRKILNSLTEEQQAAFFKSYWDNIRTITIENVRKRLTIGFALIPYVSLFEPNVKKEMRYSLSPHLNLHVFCLGVLGICTCLLPYSIATAILQQNWLNLLKYSLPILFFALLFLQMAFRFASIYWSTTYTLCLSISDIFKQKT